MSSSPFNDTFGRIQVENPSFFASATRCFSILTARTSPLKPEFLNRIDETIVFHALTKEDMKQIVTLLAKTLVERCRTQMEIELHIRDSVKAYIVETAYDPKYGARPLRRMIQSKIEDALAEEILAGRIKRGDRVEVGLKKKEIVFEVPKSKEVQP